MSFDLYVFDVDDLPEDDEEIGALLEDDSSWDKPLTSALAALVSELEARFPGLDDDPDNSPWASWPLNQSMAGGTSCGFNIIWSAAEPMSKAITAAATARGLKVYDPQSGAVTGPHATSPQGDQPRRTWWRRG